MMKQTWVRPQAMVQVFEANEYVAACIVGVVQCAYPGNGSTNGDTSVFDDYNGLQSGWYIGPDDGLYHGGCGEDSDISFSETSGSGYEVWDGVTQKNRVISNVSNYNASIIGEYQYGVTWDSQITGDSSVYKHVGRLLITYVDEAHPNRS